jgi:alpha-ketoglutarate-dependent taurine dioxygenase
MDTLEFLARKHCISMQLQKGDIQWANNLGVLHARDAFKDDANNT